MLLVALAACLLAGLTTLRLVPLLRLYLLALIVGLLTRGDYTPAWMGLAVLIIKGAATVEMMQMLYARETAKEIRSLWGYSTSAGLLFACLVFLYGFEPQATLASPILVYVRQLGQAFLAMAALSMAMFSGAFHRNTAGFTATHSWLMSLLWMDYAVIGLMTPRTGAEWRALDDIWSSVAIFVMTGWIAAVTPALRAAWGSGWGRIVRLCGLRWWLVRRVFRFLLVSFRHRLKSPLG